MPNRIFSSIVVACLVGTAGTALVTTPAFAYQELTCRRSCLAAQFATIKRCRSQCYRDFAGARRYCYDACVGRGR